MLYFFDSTRYNGFVESMKREFVMKKLIFKLVCILLVLFFFPFYAISFICSTISAACNRVTSASTPVWFKKLEKWAKE